MPSVDNPPKAYRGTHELYLRLGQFAFAIVLAWFFITGLVPYSDSILILVAFAAIALLVILASIRRQPADPYITSLFQKLGAPLLITVTALMLVSLFVQTPIVDFGQIASFIPPIYTMTLGLEALR